MADDLSSSLLSGSIRFTGLGSGTDFDSMVGKLIEIEQVRTKRLQSWRSEWEAKSNAFDQLTAGMLSLKTTLGTMDTQDKFLIKQVNSSNASVLTATASSAAEESTHDLNVVALAANDMHVGSAIFSSRDAVISGGVNGVFALTYGNRQITIDVNSNTTLSQFVTLINADPDNRNAIRASVVDDGSGFRLQLRGMDLGAGNDIIIDDARTTAELRDNFGKDMFIQTQNASNAKLVVNGWPTTPEPTAHVLKATITGKTVTDAATSSNGQFKFTYDGNIYAVAVDAGDDYLALAGKINTAVGFTMATVADSGDNVELTLTGQAGSDRRVSIINSPGTTIGNLQARHFEQIRGATDGYIERPANTISDVIPGVTMNLASLGTTTLTTNLDSGAVVENVRTFVNAVNEVLGIIKEQTQVTSVGSSVSGSLLTGNYGLQMIQQNIKSILAQKGMGFDYDLDPLVSLGSVGITTDTNQGSPTLGFLVFDESAFSSALRRDPDAVARIFSADYYPSTKETSGGVSAESTNFKFDSFVKGVTGAGEFDVSYTVDAGGTITSARINGYSASVDGNKIVAMGGDNPARGLAIEVINLTAGSYSGSVQLKAGKTEELALEIKRLTDPLAGPLEILKDNYQDIMDSIDSKIAYEEKRLALQEKNLRLRFANLEALLGRYDNISKQLTSQISSLTQNKS